MLNLYYKDSKILILVLKISVNFYFIIYNYEIDLTFKFPRKLHYYSNILKSKPDYYYYNKQLKFYVIRYN